MFVKNSSNERGGWRKSSALAADQRDTIGLVAGPRIRAAAAKSPRARWLVSLVRVAPRAFDEGDNLPIAFKAIRDEIAKLLGRDDNPKSGIEWVYSQCKGHPKEHAIIVVMVADPVACDSCGRTLDVENQEVKK